MPKTLKPNSLFFEFKRVDDDQRLVEGYCFVNEDAGDGYVWKRSAMEAATDDYMRYANVREMHQPSAVGVVDSLQWDQTGCFIQARIVDDSAWTKVKEGVYKGFSALIKPVQMRGNEVHACGWIENSLVDRPRDKGCDIVSYRVEEPLAEYEVEDVLETAELRRGAFMDAMKSIAVRRLTSAAIDCLESRLYEALLWDYDDTPEGSIAELDEMLAEFRAYVVPLIENKEAFITVVPDKEEVEPRMAMARLGGIDPAILERAENDHAAIGRLEAALESALARIDQLENSPAPTMRPVKTAADFGRGVDRTFSSPFSFDGKPDNEKERTELKQELARLEAEAKTTADEAKRKALADQYLATSMRLESLR